MIDLTTTQPMHTATAAPLQERQGPTPAQLALAAAPAARTPPTEAERHLYTLFELVEDFMDPDISGHYGELLQNIAEDQVYDGVTYLGLMRAPNGTRHPIFSKEGGLVREMLRKWEIWTCLRDGKPVPGAGDAGSKMSDAVLADPDVNNESMLQAIIHEGLSRAWAHFIELPGIPMAVIRGQHESDKMLTSGAKALMLLMQQRIILDGQLIHLLLPNTDRFLGHFSTLASLFVEIDMLAMTVAESEA